ncbi:MAG: hypothetical protein J6Q51_00325, partial [Clostridia bacterium]|nr:hypothetical protein [Clostridia bacterium]
VIEGLTGTYNAATQEVVIKVAGLEEPFDYTRIVRQNGAGETPLPTANDIYYAGTYTLEFSMRNYTVENLRPITKVISPYEVDIMPVAGTITKEYDGNINVDKAFIVMNPAKKFFASDKDKIEVLGTYDSPKAAKNKPITYFLTNSYSEVFYSYKLLTTAGTGEITPANIYLALDQKHIIYYNGENVKIDATSFGNANKINQQTGLFEKTFIGNETLTGIITLNQTNAGEYKLSEYADSISMVLQVVTLGVPGDASNYKIHFATKTNTAVVIRKAEVQIDIKDADKIYNALIQEPTYETEIYSLNGNPRGKLIESEFNSVISYTYKLSGTQTVTDPVNAGNYDIVISVPDNSNYILIKDVAGTAVTSYTVANGPLKIAKRKIAVKVSGIVDRLIKLTIKNGEIEYPEDWVAEYQVVSKTDVYDPSMNKNNGLIAGHIFSATLKTDKGIAGFYTINPVVSIDGEIVGSIVKPEEFSVTNNGVELKDNYEVVSYSAVIRVYAVSDFDASELEGLVYDSTDKVASEKIKVYLIVDSKVFTYIYGKDSVFSNLKYNGTSTNKVELAGNYSFTITAEPVPGHVQTKDIEFTVAQKVISKVSLTKDKQYDAAKTIIGSVSYTDICAGDTVTINAYYTNGVEDIAFVGVHKIRFELVGADAANYNINDLVITGEIKQREITISLDSSVAKQTYSNNTFAIDAAKVNVTSATKLVTGETLNGSVLLTKVDFGEYTFSLENANLDNLKILVQNSGADVTSNYKFTLSGKYQIQAKLIELAVSTIDFTYNAEIQKIDSNLSIANPTANEQFNTLAMQNVNIVYDKEVVNAGNYVATISSNTTNFEYKVNGYANNKIPFVVKQRIVTVNVGTVEYKYNPTSAYVTTIKNEHIVNILAKHNVTGTYKLNGIGKGVGEYNANADGSGDIVFSVGIFVNGENLVGTNYQIDKYIGTIKITPFEVTEFYLINNSFVYSKSNAADKVEVAFVDANNETQIITMADGKWGKFTVNQGTNKNVSAVDVGSYFVEVEIYNCTLATNVLDFDITKFTITDITYNANKQYDGTSAVKNSGGKTELTSSQIFEGDTLKITAFYQDKDTGLEATDVGTYTIVFVIDSTVGDYRNYQVIMTSEGTIVRKTVAIELIDKEFTYRPDGLYVVSFDKDNRPFTAVSYGRLVQDSYLFGSISITKPDYIGVLDNEAFNLSNLKVYDKENKEQTSNYSITITGENKTIKAKVAIDFGSQIDFEYTAQQVNFDPVLSFTNADADLTADISLVTFRYKSDTYDSADKPVKVGEYLLTLTLVSNCYEFEGNNKFGFKINTHTYIVTPDQIPTTQKVYGDADPILDFKVFTDLGEIVDISLTRDAGEDVGSYNVYLASWKNNNYVIEFGENTGFEAFVITKATMLNVVIKDTTKTRNTLKKVYDTVAVPEIDITNVDYTATYRGVEVSTETLSGKIYFESGVNVGNYKLVSWVITSHNFENFTLTSEVDFAITPKVIQVACNNTVKPFDNSKTFFGTIDILDENGNPINSSVYPLVIDGEYIQQEVGDNVRIALSYTGDSITNYTLEVDYLIGKIRKRNVNVIPDSDQSSVYSKAATAFDILYQVTDGEIGFEFFGELTDFITGNLYISKISEKFIAGKYDILNGLNAEYFDIAFTSGIKYTILQKELTITNSENFEKIYDGKTNVIGTFEVEGIEPGDIVEVSATFYDKDITAPNIDVSDNKVVVFRLTGDDSLNYFAQNVAGAIKPKEVILNFSYIPTTYTMHNSDRIENNKEASAVLTYLQKVSYKVMALPTPTHEGYTFEGWYFDQDYSVEITLDTLIDDPLWEIDVNEKTAYAKWTIKQFNVELIEATRVNGVYRTGSAYPGGTVVKSWNGLYDYWSEFNLTGLATANDGYVFNCYSDDLTGAPTEAIQDNKLRVYAKE